MWFKLTFTQKCGHISSYADWIGVLKLSCANGTEIDKGFVIIKSHKPSFLIPTGSPLSLTLSQTSMQLKTFPNSISIDLNIKNIMYCMSMAARGEGRVLSQLSCQ